MYGLREVSLSAHPPATSGSDDKTLRLWDTDAFAPMGNPMEGNSRSVSSVSFSFDGLRIVSGGMGKTVRLWNVEIREQIGGLPLGHSNWTLELDRVRV